MKLLKSLVIVSAILTTGLSQANPNHRHYHHGHNHGHVRNVDWIVPLVIGGAVVHVLSQPKTVVVQQPPVSYPPAPIGFRYEQILDANCNCYRIVLVQNQ